MSSEREPEAETESAATLVQQAAVDLTRQRVASEVDELVERFKPAVATQRIEANLRARLARLALSALQRPALVAGVTVAGIALAIWRWRKASLSHAAS
jgi:hypothetical protein